MKTCCDHLEFHSHSRRAFVTTLALGAGATLFSTVAPGIAHAAHTDALLLTCMDFRLENEILAYMDGRGMRDKYDHVVLAGASLGVFAKPYPDWGRTFWQHLDVAIKLHDIHEVIVLDHRDCGAYRTFLGEAAVKDAGVELKSHTEYLKRVGAEIGKRHSKLKVELGLMGLDGKVQTIT